MLQFFDPLRGITMPSVLVRLMLALLFGGIIGLERGIKRRAAGFRTYMLVCTGAALVMITNQYITSVYEMADPSRLGAQVISGIGFLGAGTIIVTRQNQVIGLTTAAGLWASACVGLAIGIGFYEGAIMASLVILFIFTAMHHIDRMAVAGSRTLELYVEFCEGGRLSSFLDYAHMNGIRISQVEFTRPKYDEQDQLAVLISLRLPKRHNHMEVVEELRRVEGVNFIEEM